MNVVTFTLKRQGIRTILYVNDLLAGCDNKQEAFKVRDYHEDPHRLSHLQITDQGTVGTLSSSARSPRQHYLFERASRKCVIVRATLPQLTSIHQTLAMTDNKQQPPSLLRLTSNLHRTSGQCDIRISVDNVSLAQPVRCPRALSPELLPNAAGDPRPKVLEKHFGQSPLQWTSNLATRSIDSADDGHIRQFGIRQRSRSTATSDSRIRRFLGILGTTRHYHPQGVENSHERHGTKCRSTSRQTNSTVSGQHRRSIMPSQVLFAIQSN
jgi:hypothetical protein